MSSLKENFKSLPKWMQFLVVAVFFGLCLLCAAVSCSSVRVHSDGSRVLTSVEQSGFADSSAVIVEINR